MFLKCNNLNIWFYDWADKLSEIKAGAFFGCSCLNYSYGVLNLPNINKIGNYAFKSCSSLVGVNLGQDLNELGIGVFSYSGIGEIELPVSLTVINEKTFERCWSLTKVGIPSTITYIGGRAFFGCGSLTEVILPESVAKIGYSAFSGCSSLEKIRIPGLVEELESGVFNGCTNLNHVEVPDKLKKIGGSAFKECKSLSQIEFPSSVTYIGGEAFYGCSLLENVEIPDSIKSIETSTFAGCNNLKSIILPIGLEKIGDYALSGCSQLALITLNSPVPPVFYAGNRTSALNKVDLKSCILKVPEESLVAYQNAEVWKKFTHIQPIAGARLDKNEWNNLKLLKEEIISMSGDCDWDVSGEMDAVDTFKEVVVSGKNVVWLTLSSKGLKGSLPLSAFKFPHLIKLDLSGNDITDSLDSSLGKLLEEHPEYCTELTSLNLSNNKLTGDISKVMSHCQALNELNVAYNHFSEITTPLSAKITTLDISNQSLDLVVDLNVDKPEEYVMSLPSIVTYDHKTRKYIPGSNLTIEIPAMEDANGVYHSKWSVGTKYNNGKFSLVTNKSNSCTYYGENEAELLTKNSNNTTFKTRLIFRQGDVNFNGSVDVTDLQSQINLVFENFGQTPLNFTAADLVDDDYLNILDVVSMVNLLMAENPVDDSDMSTRSAEVTDEDSRAWVFSDKDGLAIHSDQPVAAFDIIVESNEFTAGDLRDIPGFTIDLRADGDRKHIIGYSLTGGTLPKGKSVIAKPKDKDTAVVYAALADAEAIKIPVSLSKNSLSGIDSQVSEGNQIIIEDHNGEIRILSSGDEPVSWTVFALDGTKLAEGIENGGSDGLDIRYEGVVIIKASTSGCAVTKKVIVSQK